MQAAFLLRISTQTISAVSGGFALFCLYYAARLADPDIVRYLFLEALKWGGFATTLVYLQGKYLG